MAPRTDLDKTTLLVGLGDQIRATDGTLYRVVDITLGGDLVGVPGRGRYWYGRGTPTATVKLADVIEWRKARRP